MLVDEIERDGVGGGRDDVRSVCPCEAAIRL